MSERQTFVHRGPGGCYAILFLFAVFPVMFIGEFLPAPIATTATTAGVLLMVALAAVAFVAFVSEHRLEIDGTTMRLTERELAFGVVRSTKLVWEMPLAELTSVHEINTRTPSSRGGWQRSSVLQLPGKREIREHMLGSKELPKSEYNRLSRWLRDRLGSRFTSEDQVSK